MCNGRALMMLLISPTSDCLHQWYHTNGSSGGHWTLQATASLVHCCSLSLWYLDAETGYKVATPYTRLLEINEALGAKIDRSGSFFFAKCISYMYDEAVKFSWPCHLYQSRRQEAQEDGHGQNVRIEVKMSGLRCSGKCVKFID